ncbi:transglycosylase domain-containing protein [Lederbergia galactosidilytica]|uniref:Penicillin-binding protein n=1 Tax=Lederbergia galactosidilytica TaxID=217031 RepID=A0A177ZID0_9BACI|nr:PBP1A family penicillin-binding protein [Lederbergia galactosidilytica]KRG15870.1 penicillin-binding protein [Virgibacillus soli]MBP1915561.1 1A family penicillin-binding protein [Lederbergia galactosidilytica]OAK67524.1 penicillin-binding protein [Lederbergia galactosidilytica]
MEAEIKIKKKWRNIRLLSYIALLMIILIFIMFISFVIYLKILGPPPLTIPESSLYYTSDETVFGESHNGERRYWIGLENISPAAIQATLSIEDQTFYQHHGFDVKRIGGAVLANIKAGQKVQGASTITQQYARNLFLTMDKTWTRKISEAIYAARLEFHYDKGQILEGYLNTINFGHGAYGIEAASQYYFGKSSKELTLAEASMLMGIPKGPSIYSPLRSEEKAKRRQKLILDSMQENGYIEAEEAKRATNEQLTYIGKHPHHRADIAPYFYDMVQKELKTTVGLDDRVIALGGLQIYTTLDAEQQIIAEEIVDQVIPNSSDIQVGFAAMDPKTGFVTAMIGGRNYEESAFNRASQAVRQPGSTIKPFLYYAALEHGFTPATQLRSEKTTFEYDHGKSKYSPHNFNNRYADDEITMAQALAVSDNIYAVKTHLFLGEEVLANTVKNFGIQSEMKPVPSLALGTSGLKLMELLNGYSMFANGGKKVEPTFIKRVEDRNGKVLYEAKPNQEQILNPQLAFVMSHMMMGMFDHRLNGYASVTGTSLAGKMSRDYAGKSGSTNTDYWMAGFTPGLASVVWTGYDQGDEITLTADKLYAKNIWLQFMERSIEHQPEEQHIFKPPAGVEAVPMDPENGLWATDMCPTFRLTYFLKGTAPEEFCTEHLLGL